MLIWGATWGWKELTAPFPTPTPTPTPTGSPVPGPAPYSGPNLARNASVLAEVSEVSIPVASRFVTALDEAGFLDTRHGDLRIDRPLEFLKNWSAQLSRGTVAQDSVAQFSRGALRRPPRAVGCNWPWRTARRPRPCAG